MSSLPTTLLELFEQSVKRYGGLSAVTDNGRLYRYDALGQKVREATRLLAALGVKRGDRVAFIGNNSIEWIAAAYASYSIGAVFVPMYGPQRERPNAEKENQLEKEWQYIINDCLPKVLFTCDADVARVIEDSCAGRPVLTDICAFGEPPFDEFGPILKNVPRNGSVQVWYGTDFARVAADASRASNVVELPLRPTSDAIACLIYTSGSTGNPKGVELTHGNIISNIVAVQKVGFVRPADRSVMVLPMAHAFAHTADLHVMLYNGCHITICPDVNELLPMLQQVRPTVMCVVPKLLKRVHAKVHGTVLKKPAPIRHLYRTALTVARKRREGRLAGPYGWLAALLVHLLIFRKVHRTFGGCIRYLICGGAKLDTEVAEFMDAAGIPVLIGYGMTEASPVVSVARPDEPIVIGSSGKPIEGVTVTIDSSAGDFAEGEGEIVVSGPNVARGYYNLPHETIRAFVAPQTYRTGDIGRFDADGNVFVVGRLAERYKLSNGEWVEPVPLEDQILKSPLVASVMIYGQDRPYNIALVVPNPEHGSDAPEQVLLTEVQRHLCACKPYEKVRKVVILPEDFSQENGLLTPTLKVRRRRVAERYRDDIEKTYS